MCFHSTTQASVPTQLPALSEIDTSGTNASTDSPSHFNAVPITSNVNPMATALSGAGVNPASFTVRKPGIGGRLLEILTAGSYDPTQGADTASGAFAGGKPTKWGVLSRVLGTALQGGAEGAFLGRTTPGGGFGAVTQLNMLRNQMMLRNLMLQANLEKTASDIQKNTAQIGWLQRRGIFSRPSNFTTVQGPDGRDVVQYVDANNKLQIVGLAPDKSGNWQLHDEDQGTYWVNTKTRQIIRAMTSADGMQSPMATANTGAPGVPTASNLEAVRELTGDKSLGSSIPVAPATDSGQSMQSPGAIQSMAAGTPVMPKGYSTPKVAAVTNRNAAGVETTNLIDENKNSQTFGATLKSGVATRAPMPKENSPAQKNATSARIESYAGAALAQAGGDPNKAIAILNGLKINDPKVAKDFEGLLPQIRQRVRERVRPGKSGNRFQLAPGEASNLNLMPSAGASVTGNDQNY